MSQNIDSEKKTTCIIKITGLVQGVGFRPFIYRLANEYNLKGEVDNRNDGVYILLTGLAESINLFVESIKIKAPHASAIDKIYVEEIQLQEFENFSIVKSKNQSNQITEIGPDIAICPDCLQDLKSQPHRLNYPFINCTNCGPRFTIIRELPYDRPNTTMENFPLCNTCEGEYQNILDRRFHAQPVACNNCGPSYKMVTQGNETSDFRKIVISLSKQVSNGEVVAIKGLGGYHLLCDAKNDLAIEKLREIKLRDSKPFAVMCKDIQSIRKIAHTNISEEQLLQSWRRPIVLLDSKSTISNLVSNGLNRVGVMLPYLPLHYLLFEHLDTDCIVLTSGNLSDEPIVIDNDTALSVFKYKTTSVITNNRDIHNRCDDSVAIVINNKETLIRRSRGYAPSPIKTTLSVEGIFGAGSELVNCFGLGKEKQVIMSQHIGDLKNVETFDFYKETFERFSDLFRFKPELLVHDLHPSYLSTLFSQELSKKLGIPILPVQHHHAHTASCMAEHQIDEDVIGVSMDGVGLGTDGQIWGGEFFIANLESFQRAYHFEYIPIPGADRIPYEPWRSAIAYMVHYYGDDFRKFENPVLNKIAKNDIGLFIQLINKKVNTWNYSSAGRLFDAVAALLNICTHAGFHAEAPMRLESIADDSIESNYPFEIVNEEISLKSTFSHIHDDLNMGVKTSTIAGKFHNTITRLIFEVSHEISNSSGIKKVVLSGGTFQNKILLEKLIKLYSKSNLQLYYQQKVPANDGGIALGQILIGAKMREQHLI